VTTPTVIPVREISRGRRSDLRAVRVVWRRELLRFFRNRLRMVSSLAQPVLFLLVLGTGLASLVPSSGGVDFRTFMFPGVLTMTVLFTGFFSAISIVWDREFGFLREMLVAPVRRGAVVAGKCAGGATIATFQGTLMLALAGVVHVPYSLGLLLVLLAEMLLCAFALTSVGVLLASRIGQVESFQAVVSFIVMPLFFLSGAIFPPTRLPAWLAVLTRADPVTYAVDPMRRAVFAHVKTEASVEQALNPGITWSGWHVPVPVELGVVAAVAVVALVLAVIQFNRVE